MQGEFVNASDKARRLGRPVSSFSTRDMTLNEACPSVLGDNNSQQTMQPHTLVDSHASMKISAPRRVYSRFQDADGSEFATGLGGSGHRGCEHMSHQHLNDGLPDDDPFSTSRFRVQFDNSKNEVTEYSPSSQGTPNHPLTAAWNSIPSMPSAQGSEVFEGPNPISDRTDLGPDPPSRYTSNLALRAGTFDELVDGHLLSYADGPQDLAPLPQTASANFLSIRTNSGIPPGADVQISRRASNMNDRAGTFNELVSSEKPETSAPAASFYSEGQYLVNFPTSLEGALPSHTELQATRKNAVRSWEGSQGEDGGLDGTVSRRYTNMCDAAGTFEDLVDDDGDVLSCSESESFHADSSHAPTISFSGMLSGVPVPVEQEVAARANAMRWNFRNFMGSQNPHSAQGMTPATVEAAGIAGLLPSDLCSEASDTGQPNPLLMDMNDNKPSILHDDSEHHAHGPSMFGQWFEHSLRGERSDRSLRLTEVRTGSRNPSRGSSAAPPSARRSAPFDSLPVTAEHSTLSCALSSALSIKTPRTVLQKFSPDDSEQLIAVLSTQEAAVRAATMKMSQHDLKTGSSGFQAPYAENAPRMIPQQLQVVLPPEQDASAMEQAVLTPQEWLNKISKNIPDFPAAHMNLPGEDGKAAVFSPVQDTGTLSARLGAFRPEEESLL